ncbi:molybdenum cofactor guanylyltransferase [Algoriphagus halophytocola]|uniref:Probable molybdenum cofactor guanylyltransferase n=1 Tax=Algoriphagus halophytocola TaxID=2991499 RepID=A0ABY6MFT9_9BACT|nr:MULTISPECIES: molybdenum cofactor guanylyltransferase [unclassified Algoriphagus]UZD21496.1 molybdenum cofactor guanylyltransferase [Algoriphagus sp. TR-M5]WBL42708.1 molybdenum cofactor guanylyltransferase [Algoriphagus sp. TR-M9]
MKKNSEISAYILCGGKSKRMQSEKGLVLYKGKPFIRWIIEAVMPVTSNIILVTSNGDYELIGLPMIEDVYADKGPVGGIHTALQHSKTDRNLILSCDVPKITTELIRNLVSESGKSEASLTFLHDGKNDYPLLGVYRKSAKKAFAEAIIADRLKLCPLVNLMSHQKLCVNSQQKALVQNINSRAELQALNLLNP